MLGLMSTVWLLVRYFSLLGFAPIHPVDDAPPTQADNALAPHPTLFWFPGASASPPLDVFESPGVVSTVLVLFSSSRVVVPSRDAVVLGCS